MRDPELVPARRRRFITSAAVLLAMVLGGGWLLVAVASAQVIGDWTQSQGDAGLTGFLPDAAQPPYRESWRLDIPLEGPAADFGLSQPVVDGSSVIAVGSTEIVAADLATGRQLWSVDRDYGPPVSPAIAVTAKRRILVYTEGFGDSAPGTSATPSAGAASSSSPSPGSDVGPFDSHVAAIDLDTQQPVWDASVQLEAVSRTGVSVDGDTAFLGDNAGNVYAVAVATGELRWTADAGGFLTTSPAVSDGLVVVTVQGDRSTRPHLVAFDASDGSPAWDDEIQGGAVFASSPAIGGGRVVAGFSDQTVRAFDLADGTERWSTRLNAPLFFTGAPALTPDAVVVVDTFGQVYRLDPATGERVWDYAVNEAVTRSPGVVAGGDVLVATSTGRLAAIDLESGLLVWQSEQGDGLLRSLALTSHTVVGVRGGAEPGLVGFVEDPDGTLVSLVSPTELDLPKLLLAFLAAGVPLALLSILAGRWLLARMGPAFLGEEDDVPALAEERFDGGDA
ncbi:MAG: outer membrane protein assembly factor BamB family protein [Actinomycetota bacterium]